MRTRPIGRRNGTVTSMRTRLIGSIAIGALALAGCGGDDDGGGNTQDQVADMLIEVLEEASDIEGVEVTIDEDCIRDRVGELSDEDARAILDAGPEGDPEVSAEAEGIGESTFDCVEIGDIDLGELDSDG